MKLVRLTVVATLVVLTGCAGEPDGRAWVPGPVPAGVSFHDPPEDAPPAPDFSLELLGGEELVLAEQWRQRPVVLVFFESWCTLCRQHQAGINEVVAQYQDILLFVGIASQSEPAAVVEYVSQTRLAYPVGIDPSGRTALQYAVAEPPLVALISKDGRLLRGWPEGISGESLAEQIDELAVASH